LQPIQSKCILSRLQTTQLPLILFGQQAIGFNWLYDNNTHYEQGKLRKDDNHNHVSASTSHVSPSTEPRNRSEQLPINRGVGRGAWHLHSRHPGGKKLIWLAYGVHDFNGRHDEEQATSGD